MATPPVSDNWRFLSTGLSSILKTGSVFTPKLCLAFKYSSLKQQTSSAATKSTQLNLECMLNSIPPSLFAACQESKERQMRPVAENPLPSVRVKP